MASNTYSLSKIMDGLNRLAGWLMLLAVIWLCWGLARILWLVVAPPQAPNLNVVALQPKPVPTLDVSQTLALFETAPKREPQTLKLPPPDVKLLGVMLAKPSSMSSAVLNVNGEVASYRIGDDLGETGYYLDSVNWDGVIIANEAGNDVTIDMPTALDLNGGLAEEGASSNQNKNSQLPSTLPKPEPTRRRSMRELLDRHNAEDAADIEGDGQGGVNSNDDNGTSANTSADSRTSTAKALENAASSLKQNPATYLSSMGVMATGDGYQVTEMMPSKLRKRLGLKSGDRVLSVNGRSVGGDPTADADLLAQVKQSGQAVIEVQRGEQTITVRQQF